jgi:hypothetical protein
MALMSIRCLRTYLKEFLKLIFRPNSAIVEEEISKNLQSKVQISKIILQIRKRNNVVSDCK